MYRVLKKGGNLIIGVPNIDSFLAKLGKELWSDLDVPRHLFHFNPITIKNLLNKTGFLVENISHEYKISKKTLNRITEKNKFLLIIKLKFILKMLGILLSILKSGEWIVVKAKKL